MKNSWFITDKIYGYAELYSLLGHVIEYEKLKLNNPNFNSQNRRTFITDLIEKNLIKSPENLSTHLTNDKKIEELEEIPYQLFDRLNFFKTYEGSSSKNKFENLIFDFANNQHTKIKNVLSDCILNWRVSENKASPIFNLNELLYTLASLETIKIDKKISPNLTLAEIALLFCKTSINQPDSFDHDIQQLNLIKKKTSNTHKVNSLRFEFATEFTGKNYFELTNSLAKKYYKDEWISIKEHIIGTISIFTFTKLIAYSDNTFQITIPTTKLDYIKTKINFKEDRDAGACGEQINKFCPLLDYSYLPIAFEIFGSNSRKSKKNLMRCSIDPNYSLQPSLFLEYLIEYFLINTDSPCIAKGNYIRDYHDKNLLYAHAPPGISDAEAAYQLVNRDSNKIEKWYCTAEISIERKSIEKYLIDIKAAIHHAIGSDYVLLISPNIPKDKKCWQEIKNYCQVSNSPSIIPLTLKNLAKIIHFLNQYQRETLTSEILNNFYENIIQNILISNPQSKDFEFAIANIIHKSLHKLSIDIEHEVKIQRDKQILLEKNRQEREKQERDDELGLER